MLLLLRMHACLRTASLLFLIVCIFCFSVISTTAAQSLELDQGLKLISEPQFPGPHSKIKIRLDDYSLDTLGSKITWYRNNVEIPETKDARVIDIETRGLGTKDTITVKLARPDVAATLSAGLTLNPISVDVILEADSYTPYFYLGKPLPSRGSTVRAIAFVHDGSSTNESAYTYKWTLENTVIDGGALKGKRAITFEYPQYVNTGLLLDVYDASGTHVARYNKILVDYVPEILLYEQSPLRGLSRRDIGTNYFATANNANILAEPYYLKTTSLSSMSYTWKSNGILLTATDQKNSLPVGALSDKNSNIRVEVMTLETPPQYAERSVRISNP